MSTLQTSGQHNPVAEFSRFMDRLKPQMALALPKHMNADRMGRLALTAFSSTPALQKCSTNSIAASIMTAAQLGLEPGINGQGYLIPYGTTCTFVPGWKGLVDLVARAGRATVWTGAVYPGDKFDYQLGDEPFCRHQPGDGGGMYTHVYAIGRVRDAQMPVIEVWTRGKVQKHLDQYNKVGGRHYACASESNFEMYARKVALLQVLKYMPSSIELANAITVTHAAEEGKGAIIDGDFVTIDDQDQGDASKKSTPAQTYSAEDFAKSLPGWRKVIAGGKTADQVITMAKTKHPLTDAQKAAIRALAEVVAKVEPPPPSYAEIADKLHAAKDQDQLDDAADLIGAVSAPDQRADLTAIYDTRLTELSN